MPSSQRPLHVYLVGYSAVVTAAFALTVYFGFVRPVHGASRTAEFDRVRVHRIDVVEPDGTERLILSSRSEFPGAFFHGKEIARPDRADYAGLLFLNDEGTEDGGLIYGGSAKGGRPGSFGHLSLDQYDQDQTLSLDSELSEGRKTTAISINDMPDFALTPEVVAAYLKVKIMPPGPARAAAWAAVQRRYPSGQNRASLRRNDDASVALDLRDQSGQTRLALSVAPDGTPTIQFLDKQGHVQRTIAASDTAPQH